MLFNAFKIKIHTYIPFTLTCMHVIAATFNSLNILNAMEIIHTYIYDNIFMTCLWNTLPIEKWIFRTKFAFPDGKEPSLEAFSWYYERNEFLTFIFYFCFFFCFFWHMLRLFLIDCSLSTGRIGGEGGRGGKGVKNCFVNLGTACRSHYSSFEAYF